MILTSDNLSAINLNDASKSLSLQFIISDIQHGHFELLSSPAVALTNFIQQQVNAIQVSFVQDGSYYNIYENIYHK